MHPYRRQLLVRGLELFDLLVLAAAFFLGMVAYSERGQFSLQEMLTVRLSVSNLGLIAGLLGICHLVFRVNGLYESKRLSTRTAEVVDILKAVTFCVLLLTAAAVAFKLEVVAGRSFVAVFWVTAATGLIGSRIFMRTMLAQLRRQGRNLRQILIVGTNLRATQVAGRIESRPELGYKLVGFVDDPWSGQQTFNTSGHPLVSDLPHLSQYLRDSVVDEVFICLPLKSHYDSIRDIIENCENQGIIVRLLGRIFELRMARATADTFEDEAVVSVSTGQIDGWPALVKRLFDIAASLALLAILSPVLLATFIAVRLTSPGPVFYVQERVGINKRRFKVIKFRTMVVDAEQRQKMLEQLNEVSGPVFKITNDPRITPIGRLLRKTSIDELPQLVNVLRGDMSLVGPRPLPVRDYKGFDQDWHRRRFSVRPGITCLWQVNGRSRLPFEQWMELDMEYIDHWSLWLDMKILMKTVPAVLKGSGAA